LDKIIIHGGKRLEGDVRVSGAKNAALPVIVSSLLTDGWNIFHNVPDLADIRTIKKLLAGFGAEVKGGKTLKVNAGGITSCEAPYDLVRTMRASILVLGPLVARMGQGACFSSRWMRHRRQTCESASEGSAVYGSGDRP